MSINKLLFICVLLVSLVGATFAQSVEIPRIAMVPLTVEQGFPLEVVLTEKVRSKLNEPVHGKIIDPVYVFDREVIPSGTEIVGKVTDLRPVGKWKRVSSMLGGDFTPLHDPQITFEKLVLDDGREIPIETSAVSKGGVLLRLNKGETRAYTATVQQPGKEFVHSILWSLSPYHPQSLATGTTYKVTLAQPLEFGNALIGGRTLNSIGGEPSAGSIMHARLLTPLDTKSTTAGTAVQAVLTRPMYSADQRLIFPAGSRIQGKVEAVRAARHWNHGGELSLEFVKIEPPLVVMSSMSQEREIHGRLVGVQVPLDMMNQVHIDSEGSTHIARSKERFLGPAFATVGALPLFGNGSASFGSAFAEAYGTSFIKRVTGGSVGFGLPAGVTGLMVPPVGLGLGAYGVVRSVYSNILGRGKDIHLPSDTPIEVRLDSQR
jgi:hypothetical protein